MRQLTTLKDETAAVRFAAWLVTQKIEAHAEQEKEGWAIWVREEDQLAAAKEQLTQYQAEPDHARYKSAVQQAAALEREEQQKRERSQKNTIEMSRNWGRMGAPRSQPQVLIFIFVSIVVFALTSWGEQKGPGLRATLQICDGISQFTNDGGFRTTYVWKNLLQGEVWRLVTPMFLHFGLMHIAFNLMVMYDFGGQIENRLKSWRFLLLVVGIAVISHGSQALLDSVLYRPYFPYAGNFGGMSGVNYGLFGYLFVRSRYLNDSSYLLRPETTLIMFGWLIFCIARNFFSPEFGGNLPYVANTAHVAGLLAGAALAFIRKAGP